jgi:hypothetical protein
MPTINSQANAVLQELGGMLPESICSFEDAKREFMYARALELQKIGIATTNKTVTVSEMIVEARDGVMIMPTGVGDLIAGAVEYEPNNLADGETNRSKVVIVQVDDIPAFEGNLAIAFYGDPMRYRLSFDSWLTGRLFVYYDPIEDLTELDGDTEITFPLAFWTYLTKKTAFNLIDMIRLKLAWHQRPEEVEQHKVILQALSALEAKLSKQAEEWHLEFKRWITRDLKQGPYLRRSNMEILARGYNNTGSSVYDYFER